LKERWWRESITVARVMIAFRELRSRVTGQPAQSGSTERLER
jgi:heptosyltransferase III